MHGVPGRHQLPQGSTGQVPELLPLPRLAGALPGRVQDKGGIMPMEAHRDPDGVGSHGGTRPLGSSAAGGRPRLPGSGRLPGLAWAQA